MMLLPTATLCTTTQRGDLCASAMLRAADALSLADGPCSLSCDDFFQELADQACELNAANKTPPPKSALRVHPKDKSVATVVRWPIAALPCNSLSSKAATAASSTSSASTWKKYTPPRDPSPPMIRTSHGVHQAPTFVADFNMALLSMSQQQEAVGPVLSSMPQPQPQQQQEVVKPASLRPSPALAAQAPRRKSKDPPSESQSLLKRHGDDRSRGQSGSRGMPNGMSGLFGPRPAQTAPDSRDPKAHTAATSREPKASNSKEPRGHSKQRGAMPTNLGGLSLMLTGGGLKEAPQQQKLGVEEHGGTKRRRGSSTRRRQKEKEEQEAVE